MMMLREKIFAMVLFYTQQQNIEQIEARTSSKIHKITFTDAKFKSLILEEFKSLSLISNNIWQMKLQIFYLEIFLFISGNSILITNSSCGNLTLQYEQNKTNSSSGEIACSKNSEGLLSFNISTENSSIVANITEDRVYGMRVDSPCEIIFNISIKVKSLGHTYFARIIIKVENYLNTISQTNKEQQISIYYSLNPTTNLTQFNFSNVNKTINVTINKSEYRILIINSTTIVFMLNEANYTNPFDGLINITQILLKLITLDKNALIKNLFIKGIVVQMYRPPITNSSFWINITAFSRPIAVRCQTMSMNKTLLNPNFTVFHEVYDYSDENSYSNLTYFTNASAMRELNLSFLFGGSNYSAAEAINRLKAHYYVGIGYVNGQWLTAKGQFHLPLKASAKVYLAANLSADFTADSSAICAVCFTLTLQNNDSPTALSSAGAVRVMVCPWRQVAPKPGASKVSDSPIDSYDFVGKSSANAADTYVFGLPSQTMAVKNIDLMEFVRMAVRLSTANLLNYYIVGIQTGVQISAGSGTFKFSDLSFAVRPRQESATINCPFGAAYDLLTNECVTNPIVDKAVAPIVSIPNIGLLLKVGPFLGMLDDLSYFVYHSTAYDRNFKYVSELSWNWTNAKWTPPAFLTDSLSFSLSSTDDYAQKWVADTMALTPPRFRWQNEDLFFLNNCRGFLFYTVPFSVLVFFLLHKLYSALAARRLKLAKLLVTFSSWAYLIVSLVGDNLQYLSFRSFQQFRCIAHKKGILFLTSTILTINIGFFTLFCAIGTYLLAICLAKSTFQPSLLIKSQFSIFFLGIWMTARVFSGFIHAFIDDPTIRLITITVLQGLLAISSGYSAPMARYKASLLSIVFGHIVRFFLYLFVLFEILFPELVTIPENQDFMSKMTFFLIILLLAANALQIILHIVIGIAVKPRMRHKDQNTSNLKNHKATETKEIIKIQNIPLVNGEISQISLKIAQNLKNINNRLKSKKTQASDQTASNEIVAMLKYRQQRLKMLVRFQYEKKQQISGKFRVQKGATQSKFHKKQLYQNDRKR